MPTLMSTLIISLALAIAAPTARAQDPQFIIGFPEDNLSNDWRAAQMREIEQALSEYPRVRFLKADAQGEVSKNIFDIEDMVDQGAQLLFLGPRAPAAVTPLIERLHRQGVRIVLLTRTINSDAYDTFISPNDAKIAGDAAAFLARHLNGQGRVLMLEGVPTATTAIHRKDGFMTEIAKHSGITVATKTANYSRADAIRVVEEALSENLQFDAIYAHNDAMAIGARIALKAAGIDPASKPTVSIDYLPETREAIRNGEQLASFTYPTCGKVGVRAALDLLNGKQVPRIINVPSQLVTRDNVEQVDTIF